MEPMEKVHSSFILNFNIATAQTNPEIWKNFYLGWEALYKWYLKSIKQSK